MLRAHELALAFDGDDASGWAARIIAAGQPDGTGTIGYGTTRADAAEDAWKRHTASIR
jgi:hypothetical protein